MSVESSRLLLGIDIGTTGAKCAVYDTGGRMVGHAYQEYPMIHPREGRTEQNPLRWWDAVVRNLKTCFGPQKIDASRIAAISVSCTNAVTLVDEKGEPLYNAIGHHDLRAGEQIRWLMEHVGEELIFSVTANRLAKGTFSLSNLRWLIDNHPELVRRAHKFLMPSGFIIHRLTGVFSINRPRAGLTLMADIKTGQWSDIIIQKSQIPPDLLPNIYSSTDVVGYVTKEAAGITGLKEGTPVTAGCLDTVAATAGSGAINAGDAAITLGSCGRICYISREPICDTRALNCFSPFDGLYTVILSTDNAGISMRWFRDIFGGAVEEKAKKKGENIYEYFNGLAEGARPGAGGIIYHPYLTGEKAPIWDSGARGMFFGIGLESDYGSFVRAVMEGVAFSLKDCMRTLNVESRIREPIPIGGGIANSRIWCQIVADVLQHPVIQLKHNETETLGDMILAGLSIQEKGITKDFGKLLSGEGCVLEPNRANRDVYERQFRVYKSLYENVRTLYQQGPC
ncbi:MAG: carbohydrate kinase [Clostridium sp.]|nr:carbohydrate kinase [Clostridium sp.]